MTQPDSFQEEQPVPRVTFTTQKPALNPGELAFLASVVEKVMQTSSGGSARRKADVASCAIDLFCAGVVEEADLLHRLREL